MVRIYKNKKNYIGILYVNGKSISVDDFKLGDKQTLTTFESKKLSEYIENYKL